MVAELK